MPTTTTTTSSSHQHHYHHHHQQKASAAAAQLVVVVVWWFVLDLKMVVGGLSSAGGLLLDMGVCVELDQLRASVTLLILTVLIFFHSALTHTWLEELQQQQYLNTHTLDLCSQRHYC